MELKQVQERSIRSHLPKLTKLTRNISQILDKLHEYDVLSEDDVEQLKYCSDDPTAVHLLFEIVIPKLPNAFDLLLFSLRDTDNYKMAQLIEDSATFNGDGRRRIRRRSSASEQYSNQETRSLNVAGGEMGIAELLEDYPEYSKQGNYTNLIKILGLEAEEASGGRKGGRSRNFVLEATLLLRAWVQKLGAKANVLMLSTLFDNGGNHEAAERIRQMFDSFVDSGFAFDFPGHFTIAGKEDKISAVLDDNPSFCSYPERLFLLLPLPLGDMGNYTKENSFRPNAEKMLRDWALLKPEASTLDHLAAILAFNGHFCTAEKISHL